MKFTLFSVVCFIILVPTVSFNVGAICAWLAGIINDRWEQSGNVLHAMLLTVTLVVGMSLGISGCFLFVATLHDSPNIQLVLTSVSVLFTLYASYYLRFADHLWYKRFYHNC